MVFRLRGNDSSDADGSSKNAQIYGYVLRERGTSKRAPAVPIHKFSLLSYLNE